MARYPDLKSSGNVFLGKVPVHWKVESLRNLASVKSIKNCADKELLSVYLHLGVVKFKDIEQKRTNATSDNLTNYQLVEPGDFVLNNQQAWRGSVGVSKHEGIVSPAYLVLKLCDELDPSYSNWLLRDRAMVSQYLVASKGVGTIQRNLYWPHLKYAMTIVPPLSEQKRIASYLQAQDAHIARFIKAKRELIGLLTEQKLRIIDHAVTRGLDTSVALKPSGIDWLGDVPDNWETIHVGSAVQIVNGYPFDSGLFDAVAGYPLIRIRDLKRTDTEVKFNGPEVAEAIVQTGDLLVGMDGDFNAARWRGGRALLNQRMCCLRPRKQISTEYLALVMPKALKFINDLTLSTTVKHLSSIDVKRLRFPIPGEPEQLRIVEWVTTESAPLEEAIQRAEEEIKLIREYRDRQISDVVTGQVDVRGWAPGPDDVVAEEDLTALTGDEEIDIDGEEDDGDD